MDPISTKYLAAGLTMAIGSIASALGEGWIGARAMEAMSRNPKIADKIVPNMLVAMAVTESTAIYSLVVALILIFAA